MFVYYHVHVADADACIAAAARVQRELRNRHPGLRASLMRRPEATEGRVTLMEVYGCDAGTSAAGVDPALQDAIEAAAAKALAPWILGGRHTEVFEPCA